MTMTRERVPSTRTQSTAIVTAAFGQNGVLTIVSTFILVYLVQYAHISVRGIAVVTGILTAARSASDGRSVSAAPRNGPTVRCGDFRN